MVFLHDFSPYRCLWYVREVHPAYDKFSIRWILMKHIPIIIVAVVLIGCGESQQSATAPEAKPVAEAATPEPPTAKAPDISIHSAAYKWNIEAVKQHIAAGTDVNANDEVGISR